MTTQNQRYAINGRPEMRQIWLYELIQPFNAAEMPLVAQYYRAEGSSDWEYRQIKQDKDHTEPTWKMRPEDAHALMLALMDWFGVRSNEAEVSAKLEELRKSTDEQITWLRKQIERLTDN